MCRQWNYVTFRLFSAFGSTRSGVNLQHGSGTKTHTRVHTHTHSDAFVRLIKVAAAAGGGRRFSRTQRRADMESQSWWFGGSGEENQSDDTNKQGENKQASQEGPCDPTQIPTVTLATMATLAPHTTDNITRHLKTHTHSDCYQSVTFPHVSGGKTSIELFKLGSFSPQLHFLPINGFHSIKLLVHTHTRL